MAHDGTNRSAFKLTSTDSRSTTTFDPTFSAERRERARNVVESKARGLVLPGKQLPLFEEPLINLTVASFLKLVMLDTKHLKAELRTRLAAEKKGYDRYGYLRRYMRRAIRDKESLSSLKKEARKKIKNPVEKRDTLSALDRFFAWFSAVTDWKWFQPPTVTWVSFNRLFKIKINPEAGLLIDGQSKTLSTYNTGTPHLDDDAALIGCALMRCAYARSAKTAGYQNTVLGLRTPQAFEGDDREPVDGSAGFEALKRASLRVELAILEVLEETP